MNTSMTEASSPHCNEPLPENNDHQLEPLKYPLEWLFEHAEKQPDKTWLVQPVDGTERRWSWREARDEIGRMAAALKSMDWPKGASIAISGLNTAHWFMADLAIQWAGFVPIGLYPRQQADTVRYILEHSQTVAVFLGPMPDATGFMAAVPEETVTIGFPYSDVPNAQLSWNQLLNQCHFALEYQRPEPQDLMTIIYTSGTTGKPKGVMMSYGNIAWVANAFIRQLPPPSHSEKLFSYLPLAHLLERAVVETGSLLWCAEVHFLEKPELFAQQLKATAPTRFFAVPLVWSRLQAAILNQLPQSLLNLALAIPGISTWLQGYLRERLGLQNIHMAVSGAASIPAATLAWFHKVLGIRIQEGYGMTENGAYVSLSSGAIDKAGSVGKPFADTQFRLSEQGEIQVKHPGVMPGYFKDPEATANTFTRDGWLRTGDLGYLDAEGYLFLTGRRKDIFKTQKGKYVAPAPIESHLQQLACVDQVCVSGEGLNQPFALVMLTGGYNKRPSRSVIAELASQMAWINQQIEAHERLSAIYVTGDEWTVDNGLLTPTLKVRRAQVETRFRATLTSYKHSESGVFWQ